MGGVGTREGFYILFHVACAGVSGESTLWALMPLASVAEAPKRIHFSAFMRKAITIFVEELEKNPALRPEDFIITQTAQKDTADKKWE
jgi:hypothetical protein